MQTEGNELLPAAEDFDKSFASLDGDFGDRGLIPIAGQIAFAAETVERRGS
jgi:hypothetical protein